MTFDSPELRGFVPRRLRYALAASLLLHLLVFWPEYPRLLSKDLPAALQATLRQKQMPPADTVPAKPPQRATAAAPPLAPTPAAAAQTPLEPARAVSVPPTLALPATAPAKAAVAAAAASTPAAMPGAAPGIQVSAALLSQANASGEAADGLRGYRLAVATQARRFKRYPAEARAAGWSGSAEVRVEVGSDGQPRAATLLRSSGYEVLDRAALAMIDAGALRARLPDSLRGKAFAIVLPVMFNLDGE